MRSFLRKCRGALGIATTWGAVWAAVFVALGLIAELVRPGSIDPGEGPMTMIRVGAGYGFVSGAVFGVLLSLTEARRSIRDLSLTRAALCGALATAVFPLVTSVDDGMLLIVCPIGAALAAASVAVARKAELHASPKESKLSS